MLEADDFEGHEGDRFRVSAEDVELTLTAVTRWGPEGRDGGRQPFTVVLHGPDEPVLPARIYRFDHPAMDPFEMFIVPNGPDDRGMRYEAIFT